jgi:hypothetical protein
VSKRSERAYAAPTEVRPEISCSGGGRVMAWKS